MQRKILCSLLYNGIITEIYGKMCDLENLMQNNLAQIKKINSIILFQYFGKIRKAHLSNQNISLELMSQCKLTHDF